PRLALPTFEPASCGAAPPLGHRLGGRAFDAPCVLPHTPGYWRLFPPCGPEYFARGSLPAGCNNEHFSPGPPFLTGSAADQEPLRGVLHHPLPLPGSAP